MRLPPTVLLLASMLAPGAALGAAESSGRAALEAGIRAYDELELEAAASALETALAAPELEASERATASLYLGMLELDRGRAVEARRALARAVRLDRGVRAPDGASPKVLALLEEVRAELPPPMPTPTEPPVALVEPSPEEDAGPALWPWVAAGVGVVAAAAVVAAVVASGDDGACDGEAGGCVAFSVR